MYSITVKCKKVIFLFSLSFLITQNFYSQCFEIESILVDACGSVEGENEMVRFSVGNTALNTANMNVVWPNTTNPWLGTCKNATTANTVAALNATILGCGWLKEPTGGVLPANSSVLLITSTAIDVYANSFANLSDTLYVVFQCAGNTAGHFANWSTTPGLRTLTMSFSSPSGCNDVVTYDRTLLLNQNGLIGGSSAIRDGALVNFNAAGNPTYENFGCQAPFVPEYLVIYSISSTSICVGNTIQLYVNTSNSVTNLNWSSLNGSFNSTSNDTVIFTPSIPSPSNFYVFITGNTSCGTISDSILITVNQLPNVTANASPSTIICAGNSVTLTGGGATSYTWNNGVTNGVAFNPSLGSVLYTVTGTDANNCTNSDTITLTTINCINLTASFIPSSLIICQGESITFTDNSIGTITNWNWNFGGGFPATANTQGPHNVVFNTPGIFNITLQVTDANGNDDTTIAITVNPIINTSQAFNECQGFSITVGNNTYNLTGNYTDTLQSLSSGCDSIVNTNLSINSPIPVIIIENDTTICENEFNNGMVLHASGGTNLSWSTGVINVDSIIITQSGIVTVTSNNNGCIVQDNFELFLERCLKPTIYIPNVFTPNNDGINDIFEVKGSYIENIEVTIFNRWGNELYTWKDINDGWDGNYKGELVPDGTYFYLINVEFENREKKNLTGSVTLLR
ncbi:MAG: gliding motility-associated C-terminal domain-containing protein [Vicingaceae bacterium]|nr:gliding motility-associated C-terminal domain-containing protein [Vicingaceae bacterium]